MNPKTLLTHLLYHWSTAPNCPKCGHTLMILLDGDWMCPNCGTCKEVEE